MFLATLLTIRCGYVVLQDERQLLKWPKDFIKKTLLTVTQRHYNKDLMWKIVLLLMTFFF